MKRIYLDHNATTPVHPEVFEAMKPYFLDIYGNASSVHEFGRKARVALEQARESIAKLFNCSPEEIVFTSGGTESDNMAIKGAAFANKSNGNHIITSAIEHHAVLESCHSLEQRGYEVTVLTPDAKGLISPDQLRQAIKPETILVSIMHANNEIGIIQDIPELAGVAHDLGVLFHTDAVQSAGKIPYTIDQLGVDLLAVSGHKIYGPKGVGLLYIKKKTNIRTLSHGGSHEFKRRAGTENVAGAVGLAKALEIGWRDMESETTRLNRLTSAFVNGVKNRIDDITIIGDQENRVPNTVNIAFEAIEGESIVLSLDMKGIAVSSGSACSSGAVEPSHVVLALGIPGALAQGSIRFSFGRHSDEADLDYILDVLEKEVARLRSISPLYSAK
ncbi:MAG: cysteine desulfurase [candidate division Zixibacteria bacterium]|nr:cysteine desulfurase [candidate division Zixibacteria bacterium]